MSSVLRSRRARIAAACLVQALLVAGAVAPQLSARVTGELYLLDVAPVDPVDPFRGAYVALDYPALPDGEQAPVPDGTVFVPLSRGTGDRWTGTAVRRTAPGSGPYLRCASNGYALSCGIESLFASQDEARRIERELADGAVARVRIDGRGHAALVGLQPRP